jgi:hypothetical protein
MNGIRMTLVAFLTATLGWLQPGVQAQLLPGMTPLPAPSTALPTAGAAAAQGSPRIAFSTLSYDFGRAQAGDLVKCEFVVTNIGTSTLELIDVRPGCGCTTAGTWQKQVQPGQTTSIPITFNSANFAGPVHKQVTVTCNDTNRSVTTLEIQGNVWKPIEITPLYVYFNLTADMETNEVRSVRIVSHLDAPITLSAPESSNKGFDLELKTIQPGKEFELLVKAGVGLPGGTVQGNITVKTDSTNTPVINLSAIAVVQQPVMAMPSQVTLAPGPLPAVMRMGVTVRSTAPTNITVTAPTVSVPGVEATVQEVQIGRVFNVLLTFPQGFNLPLGTQAELSVKTSHPKYQEIKVPIVQMPRPGVPPVATAQPAVQPMVNASPTRPQLAVTNRPPPPAPPLPTSQARQ